MPRSHPTCVLISGGLDSAVLLHRILAASDASVWPVYLRFGLRWEAVELRWLMRVLRAMASPRLRPLQIIDMPLRAAYGSHWGMTGRGIPGPRSADRAVYLPGRNLLLISHAAVACAQRKIARIALGTLRGNPFGDATPQFFSRLARCLRMALRSPMEISTPLRRFTKAQLIRSAPAVPFELTFSCLRPQGDSHCGRCNKCAERQRAFRMAGVDDPTRYAP